MIAQGWLRFEQTRELVRLLRETREIPPEGRGLHLVSGMRRMLGAVVGGCVTDRDFQRGGRGAFQPVWLDGWDSSTIRALEPIARRGNVFHPVLRGMMERCTSRPGELLTEMRQGVVTNDDWYRSPYFVDHLRPARLDHHMFSTLRVDSSPTVQGLGFYRATSDRPFDESDRALLHLFHLECGSLLEPASGDWGALVPLARRERETLNCLLEGLSDKEIAARLEISRFTVQQYNKSLFRKFKVHSRAELIAKVNRARRASSSC